MKLGISTLISLALVGCAIPHKAEFLNERKKLAEADLTTNGILAFETDNPENLDVQVDFLHVESEKNYRIDFYPGFSNSIGFSIGPIPVAEKKLAKDVVSDSVALFQLPPGTYTPQYLIFKPERGDMGSWKAEGKGFDIESGKVTSAGMIVISPTSVFLGKPGNARIESNDESIEPGIRAVEDSVIAGMEIIPVRIRVAPK